MKIAFLFCYFSSASAVWNYYDKNFLIPDKTRGTHRTSTKRPGATTRALFYFEGVDYDLMPENLHKKNNDCHSHFVWCIQNQTLMNPVCGWNKYTHYLDDYYSPCEIELQNCRHRLLQRWPSIPQKGFDMRNDLVFYNGEGYDCKYYARMGGDPVENYLRGGRRKMDNKSLILDRMPNKVLKY